MLTAVDLNTSNINTLFLKYFWPAFLSVVIKSILIMVEGIYIGQGIGPLGMASAGLIMPLQAIFTAIAIMIGVGGAALMSNEFGKGCIASGQGVFRQSLMMVLSSALALVAAGYIWQETILVTLGAEGPLVAMVSEYLSVMLIFFVLHALVVVLTVFVINDTNPLLPMIAMVCGGVASIGLGYLFIFEWSWGIKGAAYASVIAQIVLLLVLSWHFMSRQGQLKFKFGVSKYDRVKEILHIGSPMFLLEVATIATMVIFNYVLLDQYSEQHLAAYGITMNLGLVLLIIMGAIGQACQPILSYSHGHGDLGRERSILSIGIKCSVLLGGLALCFVLLNTEWLVQLYIDDQPIIQALAVDATQLYFSAAVFLGLNLMVTTFFQAIKQPNIATIISLSRGFLCVLAGLYFLPIFFPEQGIWSLTLAAEFLTCLLSFALLRSYLRKNSHARLEGLA